MSSLFDYDDSANLAFNAKTAGKNLVAAKHEVLSKTGDFLFLAHTDKEFALRCQMVDADIESSASRKMSSVSDSKSKLARALYDEWALRHAKCEICKTVVARFNAADAIKTAAPQMLTEEAWKGSPNISQTNLKAIINKVTSSPQVETAASYYSKNGTAPTSRLKPGTWALIHHGEDSEGRPLARIGFIGGHNGQAMSSHKVDTGRTEEGWAGDQAMSEGGSGLQNIHAFTLPVGSTSQGGSTVITPDFGGKQSEGFHDPNHVYILPDAYQKRFTDTLNEYARTGVDPSGLGETVKPFAVQHPETGEMVHPALAPEAQEPHMGEIGRIVDRRELATGTSPRGESPQFGYMHSVGLKPCTGKTAFPWNGPSTTRNVNNDLHPCGPTGCGKPHPSVQVIDPNTTSVRQIAREGGDPTKKGESLVGTNYSQPWPTSRMTDFSGTKIAPNDFKGRISAFKDKLVGAISGKPGTSKPEKGKGSAAALDLSDFDL
jgi:hypothetical protein